MNYEYSCGAVVFTRIDGAPHYLLVRAKDQPQGCHGFPKGHMEGDETEQETARREIFEETGLCPAFLPGFYMQDEYDLSEKPGTRKRVTYFLAEFGDEPLVPLHGEIQRIHLLPYEEALALFDHESTHRILSAAHTFLTA